jgi:uncharacterized protein YbjT (DUF2867 family)
LKRILITGAAGNVGTAILEALQGVLANAEILAGVRDLKCDSETLRNYNVTPVAFDFEKIDIFNSKKKFLTSFTNPYQPKV